MRASSTFFLSLSVLVFSVSCVQVANVKNRCKDSKFCVNSKMPLLRQGSSKLHPIIRKRTGNKRITRDTGWCSAVASTMAVAGEKLIAPKNIKHHGHIEAVKKVRNHSNIDERTKRYGNIIFDVGQTIKTRWQQGGTSDNNRKKGMAKYYKAVKSLNTKTQEKKNKDAVVNSRMQTSELIKIFQKDMPAFATSMYYYDKQSNGSYKIKGGHALAVNGYEGKNVKLYDPWGRIYNIKLTTASERGVNKLPIVQHVSGDYGFARAYSSSSRKIALRRYNTFYTRNKK